MGSIHKKLQGDVLKLFKKPPPESFHFEEGDAGSEQLDNSGRREGRVDSKR